MKQRIPGIALVLGLILLIYMVTVEDEPGALPLLLIVFGVAGLAYTSTSRMSEGLSYRLAVATGIGTGLFLIWSNMAVGLIGSEDNVINLAYFGLIAVGFAGALVARFQPKGMTWVMGFIAAGQVSIAGYALATGAQHLPHSSVGEILGVTAFFTVFWVASGLLFGRATLQPPV